MSNDRKKTGDSWFGSREELVHRLMTEFVDDDRARAEGLSDRLGNLDHSLQPAFLRWLRDGEVDASLEVHGYTIGKVLDHMPVPNVPGAFTWLDALVKRPVETARRLNRGFSYVEFPDTEKNEEPIEQ